MSALLAGFPRPPVFEPSHRQGHTRGYFRHGLFLSGALHLALLLLLLALTRGHEEALRLYSDDVDLIPWHDPPVYSPPIDPSGGTTTASHQGLIEPVDAPPLPEIEFPVNSRGVDWTPESRPGGPDVGPRTDPSETGAFPDTVVWVTAVEVPPVPIDAPKPSYPEWAREANATARILLHVQIAADGTVKKVVVKMGANGFTNEAVEAIYRWRYKPAMMNGRPVPVWLEIPVNFTLH